jgi:copper chaperone CopZ
VYIAVKRDLAYHSQHTMSLSTLRMKSRLYSAFPVLVCFAVLVMTPVSVSAQTRKAPVQAQAPSRLNVDIKGMYCESCEKTIRAMLMRTPGVKSAAVSAKTGRAMVTYDASRATPVAILSTISKLGYTARIATAKRGSA